MRLATVGVILSAAALSVASVPPSGPARLLRDINTQPGRERASSPRAFAELDGVTLFTATSPETGRELWRTDGTGAGTFLLREFFPGPIGGVSVLETEQVGDVTYFAPFDAVYGTELWRTDGTREGTRLVKDIRPGRPSGVSAGFSGLTFQRVQAGGLLYFLANDGSHGLELWRSDGTESGTFLLKDICPGSCTPFVSPYFERLAGRAVGNALYFYASDDLTTPQLWKTDGTAAGTVRVVNVNGSITSLLGEAGGLLLLAADDGVRGTELWRSDGTEGGTYVLADLNVGPSGSSPRQAVSFDGKVYFRADIGFETRFFETDGTPEGTQDVANSAGPITGVFGGKLYFFGSDPIHGRELWVTDGTPEGTKLVKEIVPGANTSFSAREFTEAGGTLYFMNDLDIWRTDGTEEGTSLFAGGLGATQHLRALGGHVYFERLDETHGWEPWVTDGTTSGTTVLRDIKPGAPSSLDLSQPGRVGTRILFSADDAVHGHELWSTDGTAAGTALVSDLNPLARTDESSFEAFETAAVGSKLVFLADDGVHGYEPWVTDGTGQGTRLLADIVPTSTWFPDVRFAVWQDRAYFPAYNVAHGNELWVTDGTEAGTQRVGDVAPDRYEIVPLDSNMLLGAIDPEHGYELWTSDGTEAGTRLLRDINPGPASSYPTWLVRAGDAIYCFAYDGVRYLLVRTDGTEGGTVEIPLPPDFSITAPPVEYEGVLWFADCNFADSCELWRSDGTIAGTGPVASLDAWIAAEMVVAGDTLYVFGHGFDVGWELWRSDGTAEGTYLLKDIEPGVEGSGPADLTPAGDTLFFTVDDGTHGREVWKTDGTEAGTVLVSDIQPGAFTSSPSELAAVDGVVFFSAGLNPTGLELWRTDGTEAGTYLVQDLLPGMQSSSPVGIVTFGRRVAFTAVDDLGGREPWVARAAILTRQPDRAIRDLADEVRALGLPNGIEQRLTAKLDAAGRALARPNGQRVAQKHLSAFERDVESSTPPIAESAAADLLEFAGEIEDLLGATTPALPRTPLRELAEPRLPLDRAR